MTGKLKLPVVGTRIGTYVPKYLSPTSKLCRVAVRSSLYTPCDWNTRRSPMGLDVSRVGRFDPIPGDDVDFLYGAESSPGQAVAIQETLRGKLSRDPARGGQYVLDYHELEARTLVKFRLSERIILADIRRQRGREAFGASEELQYHEDRDTTREWGSFIRSNSPTEVCGIAYNSTQETAGYGCTSFILWRDRLPSLVLDPYRSISLHDDDGVELVEQAFDGYSILII